MKNSNNKKNTPSTYVCLNVHCAVVYAKLSNPSVQIV